MKKVKSVFGYMEKYKFEQVIFFQTKIVDLKGIACFHNTTIGPALGPTKVFDYFSESEALYDGLKISEQMTYKNAAAGIHFGGGSVVLLGDKDKVDDENYLRAYGRHLESFYGRMETFGGPEVSEEAIRLIGLETNHALSMGNRITNLFQIEASCLVEAIKVSCEEKFTSSDLTGLTVVCQGLNNVSKHLIDSLLLEGAYPIVVESQDNECLLMAQLSDEVEVVSSFEAIDAHVHVVCPFKKEFSLTAFTPENMIFDILIGSLDNTVMHTKVADLLKNHGVLYAPDFIVNVGVQVLLEAQLKEYNDERIERTIDRMGNRLRKIYQLSKLQNCSTYKAGKQLAEDRIDLLQKVRRDYLVGRI